MRAQAGLNREPPAIQIAAPKPTPTADAHEQLYRWELLAILWGCLFLHQGGRQVYNSLIPLMRTDLSLTDVQLGLVASCFTLMYGMVAPFAGFLGDIWQRRFVIVLSLALFGLSGLLLVVGVRCIPSQPIAVVARTGTRH